jgi:protein TonB
MDTLTITQSRSNERLLWICIAGSMLLHALVVWQVHGVKPAPPPVTQIKATIRPPAPPAPPAAVPEPPRPVVPDPPKPEQRVETPPEPPKPVAKPAVPEIKPLPKTADSKPAPTVAPQPAPPPTAPAPEAKPAPAPDAPAFRTPSPTSPSAPNANSADMDLRNLVRGYQEQLKVQTERYKRYPSEAMQQAWEGTATVLVHVGTDGKIAGMEVTQTSGHEMLDEQARIAVNKAKPLVRVPEGLQGKAFDAAVRVIFTLKKEDK